MRKWSEEDTKFLIDMYGKAPAKDIAIKLNRSVQSVYEKIKRIRHPLMMKRKPLPLVEMDNSTRMYIAGLFDADGTVGLYRSSRDGRYIPSLSINSSFTEYARWISETTGISKPYKTIITAGRGYFYQVSTNGRQRIRGFLIQIIDHLILKKDQAITMINWIDGKTDDEQVSELLKEQKRKP